ARRKDINQGLLVDFQNDFVVSAQNGLPVYRVAGGAGYVWVTTNDDGEGTLRFFTVEASALVPTSAFKDPQAEREKAPERIAKFEAELRAAQAKLSTLTFKATGHSRVHGDGAGGPTSRLIL